MLSKNISPTEGSFGTFSYLMVYDQNYRNKK